MTRPGDGEQPFAKPLEIEKPPEWWQQDFTSEDRLESGIIAHVDEKTRGLRSWFDTIPERHRAAGYAALGTTGAVIQWLVPPSSFNLLLDVPVLGRLVILWWVGVVLLPAGALYGVMLLLWPTPPVQATARAGHFHGMLQEHAGHHRWRLRIGALMAGGLHLLVYGLAS